jgi:DNA-binding transcriptional regulator YiaG
MKPRVKYAANLRPVNGERAGAMSPADFNRILEKLDLSQVAAARLLDVNERTVRRWATGDSPVLPTVARFLRFLARAKISPVKVMETLAE